MLVFSYGRNMFNKWTVFKIEYLSIKINKVDRYEYIVEVRFINTI